MIKPLKREELNQRLNLKTTHSNLVKIEQLRVLSSVLNTNPEALSAFWILMQERHQRAEINSRQALEVSHKNGIISKLQKTIYGFENSEILNFSQFIWNALQKRGKERKTELIKHELVHKDDYNLAVADLRSTIEAQKKGIQQVIVEPKITIKDLENTVDSLRRQQILVQDYITNNYGLNNWQKIANYIHKNIDRGG